MSELFEGQYPRRIVEKNFTSELEHKYFESAQKIIDLVGILQKNLEIPDTQREVGFILDEREIPNEYRNRDFYVGLTLGPRKLRALLGEGINETRVQELLEHKGQHHDLNRTIHQSLVLNLYEDVPPLLKGMLTNRNSIYNDYVEIHIEPTTYTDEKKKERTGFSIYMIGTQEHLPAVLEELNSKNFQSLYKVK